MNLTVSRRKHDITKKMNKKLHLVYNPGENKISQIFELKHNEQKGLVMYFDDYGAILYNVRNSPSSDPEKVIRYACSANRNEPDINFRPFKSIGKPYFYLKRDDYFKDVNFNTTGVEQKEDYSEMDQKTFDFLEKEIKAKVLNWQDRKPIYHEFNIPHTNGVNTSRERYYNARVFVCSSFAPIWREERQFDIYKVDDTEEWLPDEEENHPK